LQGPFEKHKHEEKPMETCVEEWKSLKSESEISVEVNNNNNKFTLLLQK
jgi:hypothetical protein